MTEDAPDRTMCLHTLIEAQAARTPDRVAVVFERQQLTFSELDRRAALLARQLEAMGAGPDVPVGLFVERSLDMVVGILGILKSGAAYLPIDTAYPRERIGFMLDDARATIAVTQSGVQAGLPLAPARCVGVDRLDWDALAPVGRAADRARSENLAYVIYTSGSTGRPKGVGIEHRNIVNYVLGVVERLRLGPAMSYATVSTIAADLGNTAIFPPLVTGGCLHVIAQGRTENQALLSEYFRREQIDVLKIVPSHLAALQGGRDPELVMPRRRLILGGEASRLDWIDRLRALAPDCEIHNHYGPTESTVGVLTYRVSAPLPLTRSGTLPLGRPLPHSQVYILGDDGQPVPTGEQGELHVGGRGVARGYLHRPELTAEKFVEDRFGPEPGGRLYRTGDLARFLPDGDVEFCGRADDQVKVHGFRIEPGEIEQVLRTQPGVREAVVLARPDVSANYQLVAYVVPLSGTGLLPANDSSGAPTGRSSERSPAVHETPTPASSRKFLGERLPQHMIPSAFVLMDKIPLTANGKVDRQALAAVSFDTPHDARHTAAPRTDTQRVIASIWAELLNVGTVGIDSDFFDLGGHSLLAIKAVSRVRDVLGVDIQIRTLFEHSTVETLSTAVESIIDAGRARGVSAGINTPSSIPRIPRQARRTPAADGNQA